MSNPKEIIGNDAGMWNVVMYITRRFPTIVLFVIIVGLGIYGAQFLTDERDKTQRLYEASQLRNAELEKQRQQALELARDKQVEAATTLAAAEAKAFGAVQERQVDVATRIQTLVLGQLKTMEELEKIREKFATDLNKQIITLETLRDDAQKKLANAEKRLEIAGLLANIEELDREIKSEQDNVMGRISDVTREIDDSDKYSVSEIEKIIAKPGNQKLSAALEIAMYLKSKNTKWMDNLIVRIESSKEIFSAKWVNDFFNCCDQIDGALWEGLLPTFSNMFSESLYPVEDKLEMVSFFSQRPENWKGPIFEILGYHDRDYLWQVLDFLIDVGSNKLPGIQKFQRGRVPLLLYEFDTAAAHVWATILTGDDEFDDDAKKQAQLFFQHQREAYPVIKSAPVESLIKFWTHDNILDNYTNYLNDGTNEAYKRGDN